MVNISTEIYCKLMHIDKPRKENTKQHLISHGPSRHGNRASVRRCSTVVGGADRAQLSFAGRWLAHHHPIQGRFCIL